MSSRDTLINLLDAQRKQFNYASSSPWYRSTKSAIESLKLAEEATNPKDRFSNLWLAVNHLYNPVQRSGEEENKALSRWGSAIVASPSVETSLKGIRREALEAIQKAEGKLLYDVQRKRDREGKVLLASWLNTRQPPASLKAIQYLLGISRDCRNATFHANYDPSNRTAVKGTEALVEVLEPFTLAAIDATIRNPIPGTTGRVPTYRGFLWPYFSNSNGFFSDYYLEELLPDKELGAFPVDETAELLKGIGKAYRKDGGGLLDADAGETATQWLEPVLFPALDLNPLQGPKIVGTEGVYEPSYAIPIPDHSGTLEAEYQGKAAGEAIRALIFVLPWDASLDGTWPGSEQSALQHVQEALRASDVMWAILTNGQQLRLLRKETVIQTRSFAEVDLATILARMGTPDRDDAIRSFRYGRALFSGPSLTETGAKDQTRIDRVLAESKRHGAELGEELKRNVFTALEHLGEGFRYYLQTQDDVREALRNEIAPDMAPEDFLTSEALLEKIYESSLALMYRLLFLFYAESRDLLPMDQDLYREEYSLESLRDEVAERRDSPDDSKRFVKGGHDLYERLKELFELVNGSAPSLVPAFNGGLFSPQNYWMVDRCLVGDLYLAEAVDLLSRTRLPWRTGLVKVTYRDLSVRHLGEIYEGILEYHAHIATEGYVVLERTKSGRKEEYYEEVAGLATKQRDQLEEWREARATGAPLPKRNKVRGEKPKGSYFLVSGGRESKRKSSGSYYTPDYIVQYIVENTLGPLVRGENREGDQKDVPLSSDEILDLKVLDPAMGSGHFLVAALEYLARAYWEALNREGKDEDGVMSDEEYTACKRRVAERCIYGVDLNPLAVELAKLSIWLTTMDPRRPLSFLNHHLKCGNALLGAWVKDLGSLPGSNTTPGQGNLFKQHFMDAVPKMVRDVSRIMERETLSTDDIKAKKVFDQSLSATKAPFVNIADAWMATYFSEEARDYDVLLSDPQDASKRTSESAQQQRFFHWELEFPELWFDENGNRLDKPGFGAAIGNPPYGDILSVDLKSILESLGFPKTGGRAEIYANFIHQLLSIVRTGGYVCIIIPNTLLDGFQFTNTRKKISSIASIDSILDYNNTKVFEDTEVYTMVIKLTNSEPDHKKYDVKYISAEIPNTAGTEDDVRVYSDQEEPWRIVIPFVERLESSGLVASLDPFVARCKDAGLDYKYKSVGWQKRGEKPKLGNILIYKGIQRHINDKKLIKGADISRYSIEHGGNYLIHDYDSLRNSSTTIMVYQDLLEVAEKIVTRQTSDSLIAAIDRDQLYTAKSVHTTIVDNSDYCIEYVCAILNSSIMDYIYRTRTGESGRTFAQVKVGDLRALPIRKMGSITEGLTDRQWIDNRDEVFRSLDNLDCSNLLHMSERLLPLRDGGIPDVVNEKSSVVQLIIREIVIRIEQGQNNDNQAHIDLLNNLLDSIVARLYGLRGSADLASLTTD